MTTRRYAEMVVPVGPTSSPRCRVAFHKRHVRSRADLGSEHFFDGCRKGFEIGCAERVWCGSRRGSRTSHVARFSQTSPIPCTASCSYARHAVFPAVIEREAGVVNRARIKQQHRAVGSACRRIIERRCPGSRGAIHSAEMWRGVSWEGIGRVVLTVTLSGCSPPERALQDAPVPDAPAKLCGNGVVDPTGLEESQGSFSNAPEACDDGELNGSKQSLCSRHCYANPPFVPSIPYYANLGAAPKTIHWIELSGVSSYGYVYSNTANEGPFAIRELPGSAFTPDGSVPAPPSVALSQGGVLLDVGTVRLHPSQFGARLPVWIERVGVEQKLYIATLAGANEPGVHQIEYPFADGVGGRLTNGQGPEVVIVDQSTQPPYDLLVAVVSVRSPSDVHTKTWRFPSPGTQRGALVHAGLTPRRPHDRQLIQFFPASQRYVLLDVDVPENDRWAEVTDYEINLTSVGQWPYTVASGIEWYERLPENRTPVALLTATGDIYTWDFSTGPNEQELIEPFGTVAPGSGIADIRAGVEMIWALQPDGGPDVFLTDSDYFDARSPSLRPLEFPRAGWSSIAYVPGNGPFSPYVIDARLCSFGRDSP